MINFIDLFAGCGGLTEGFYKQGYNALAHVEIDHYACETLRTRMKHYGYSEQEVKNAVLEADITSEDIIDRFRDVVGDKSVDVIIGGPPCQSFSSLGVAKDENNMEDDPRNFLFESYVKILNAFLPKVFVFENVTGMLKAKVKRKKIFDLVSKELSVHYNIVKNPETIVLNATHYGVPQERKRVILLGVRKDLKFTPDEVYSAITKTHYAPGEIPSDGQKKFVSVREAIDDLPWLRQGEGAPIAEYAKDVNECSEYQRHMRANSDNVLRCHVARINNAKDVERYQVMALNHWNFLELLENRPDLGHEKRRVFFNSYKVQWWDTPSKTIIAHLYKDGNQFIHPDYTQGRSITVREAARLQSFPDDFIFEESRTEQFKQIGNAVPPLLAEAIAKAFRAYLSAPIEEEKMIFKNVSDIEGITEKNYFKEKIALLIKIVDAVCKKYSFSYTTNESGVVDRLIEIGIIGSPDQAVLLQTVLPKSVIKDLYRAVATINENYGLFKPFIINLSNAERKKLQEIEKNRLAPTMVDLFCGAGGLSLGFKQNGFKTLFANDFDPLCIETYKYNHPEIPSESIVWRPFKHISYPMLYKRFQATLMDLLRQKLDKNSFYPLECYLFKTYKDGFYVYAKPNPSTDSKKVLDYIVRYT